MDISYFGQSIVKEMDMQRRQQQQRRPLQVCSTKSVPVDIVLMMIDSSERTFILTTIINYAKHDHNVARYTGGPSKKAGLHEKNIVAAENRKR